MAGVQKGATMILRSKAEMKLLLYGLTPSKTHDERVRAYGTLHGLLENIRSIPKRLQNDLQTLWLIIQQDIVSSDEEIAGQSLRVLGIVLRLAKLTDPVACSFLNTLLALITTTSIKRICTLGLWCISKQELSHPILVLHLKRIVTTLVHGIDNPQGSSSITHEAFQALIQLTNQLPQEMREHSVSWAPPLYRKILNSKTSELAQKCLSCVESVVLPPFPDLTQAVVTDLQLRLLTKMKTMIEGDEREAVSAVQAWSWLIKFLGKNLLQEKTLINEMLKILEKTFTSYCAQVRNASQVAWMSIIDTFVPSTEASPPTEITEASKAPSSRDSSSKRLKLLMTPLVTTISWEKVLTIQRSCFSTWIHFLCRLGARVNECLEFDTVVFPMLEVVLKLGPRRTDGFVWAACVDILKNISAPSNFGVPSPGKVVQTPELVLHHSPRTPVGQAFEGGLAGPHHHKIQWSPWRLNRPDNLLKLVKLLWSRGVAQFDDNPKERTVPRPEEDKFDASVRCWRLLVQSVKSEEETSSLRPSGAHVTAVHLLLDFLSWACRSSSSQRLPSAVWQLVEILMEVLQPVILTSSFYKVQPPLEELARYVTGKLTDYVPLEECTMDMVTPVVYISTLWFGLIWRSEFGTEPEDLLLRGVTSILTTARSGFDVNGSFHGFAWILDSLGQGIPSFEEESSCTNMHSTNGGSRYRNLNSLLQIWRTVADQLREHVDRGGDVALGDPGGGDFGYHATWTLLLFPIKVFLRLSLREYDEVRAGESENFVLRPFKDSMAVSETQFLSVESTWFRLYNSVSRFSSCRPSSSDAFIGGFFNRVTKVLKHVLQEEAHGQSIIKVSSQCLRLLGDVVVHAINHAEVPNLAMLAISRKRRKTGFGASSVRVQYLTGVESEDASQLRDLLSIGSKLLTLSYEHYKRGDKYSSDLDVVSRIFAALASIAQQITTQKEAVQLLKVLSQPFTRWLGMGAEGGGKDGVSGVTLGTLQDTLSQAWDGLLSCLQACHPGLIFDTALLDVQAPTLSIALLHTHGAIADRALTFWEATYGSRGYPLKYPSALVEVFCKLRHKVEVTLPGWGMGMPAVRPKFIGDVYTRHPLARFMPQNASREQHLSLHFNEDTPANNLVGTDFVHPEPCAGTSVGLTKETVNVPLHGDMECTLEKENTFDLPHANVKTRGIEDDEHLLNGADVSPLSTSRGALVEGDCSLDDFMRVVNSALKKIPEKTICDTPPENSATGTEFPHNSGAQVHDGQVSVPPLFKDWHSSTDQEITRSVDRLQASQPIAIASKQVVTDGPTAPASCSPVLITPPVTSIDPRLSPPKISAGEQGGITVVTVDPMAQVSTVSSDCSQLPRRRKKLNFPDAAQDYEFGVGQSLQETSITQVDNQLTSVENLQKVGLMEIVRIPELQSCADGLIPPAGVTEVEDCGVSGVSGKENVPPSVPQIVDFDSACSALNEKEVAGPLSPCQEEERINKEGDDSSAGLRSSARNSLELFQMKERFATAFRHNPTLTFREIVRSEQCHALPRAVLIKLKKHLEELKTSLRSDVSVANGGDEARRGQGEESQHCKEQLRVTIDAVNQTLTQDDYGQPFTREDASAVSPLDPETEKQQSSGEEDANLYRGDFYERLPSRRPRLRRISDVLVPLPKSLNLRSSGKLRGGKHWRIDAEAERACASRRGNKKRKFRMRRALNSNSVPQIAERIQRACLAHKVPKIDLSPVRASSVAKPAVKPDRRHHVAVSNDYFQYDVSGFRIRDLDRGMFDTSYGASEGVEPSILKDRAVPTRERFTPLNRSRKCKVPKRVLCSPCSDGLHQETTEVREIPDAMNIDESLPRGEMHTSSLTTAAAERDNIVRSPETQLTSHAGRLPSIEEEISRLGASSTDRQNQDENSKDSPNIALCHGTDDTPPADCSHVVPVIPQVNEAKHCHHPVSALVPGKDVELKDEIERLLHMEGVRVYHILAALAGSAEWTALEDGEAGEAEKLVSKMSQMLSERRVRSSRPCSQPHQHTSPTPV